MQHWQHLDLIEGRLEHETLILVTKINQRLAANLYS